MAPAWLLGLAGAALGLACAGGARDPAEDPLARLGFEVTAGAAPGYLPDRACALCHHSLSTSYQEVGMARSFYRPRPEKRIEDFASEPFFHEPSRQYVELRPEGEGLLFRRWQLDAEGRPIHLLEQQVDWILGSGNHSRVYLYRTPWGELYQLPLAWYAQTASWGMAPGYDRADHDGVTRRVRRECMFCHNAYPEVAAGSDAHGEPQLFPAELPEGTGCQRCHGPGAEHARAALAGDPTGERIRAAIVNPGRLPPARRDDVCFECHMQPSVALPGIRRFGVGDYAFRPGGDLAAYLVQLDVVEEGRERGERFEINHHPYRLRQSRCYRESEGALSCLTCHDPHRKVPEAERAAHFRAACLTCHRAEDCRADGAAAGRPASAAGHGAGAEGAGAASAHGTGVDAADCVACHMPKRRTQDVVRVVMTDHWIRRRPGGAELLAPLAESDPVLVGLDFLYPERAPEGVLGETYRAAAVVRSVATEPAVTQLARMLAAAEPPDLQPYLDLAEGQVKRRSFAAAEATLRAVLVREPGHPLAREWLGLALAGQGRAEEAAAVLRELLAASPDRPEARFNLGLVLLGRGEAEEARSHFERALELRPNLVAGWFDLGLALAELERLPEAASAFERALAIDPTHTRAYVALGRTLLAAGERERALRFLAHGARAAARPEEVARELAGVGGS